MTRPGPHDYSQEHNMFYVRNSISESAANRFPYFGPLRLFLSMFLTRHWEFYVGLRRELEDQYD